jgi:Ca2+-binding EF-hand superfamily protein
MGAQSGQSPAEQLEQAPPMGAEKPLPPPLPSPASQDAAPAAADAEVEASTFSDVVAKLRARFAEAEPAQRAAVDALTPSQVAEYIRSFHNFDLDGGGSIDVSELGTLMNYLGMDVREAALQAMIESVDSDGSGEVELDEFLEMMVMAADDSTSIWGDLMAGYKGTRELFNEVDADGSGTLDKDELRVLARKLGKYLTAQELDLAMSLIDEDGSGMVEYGEFEAWWRGGGMKASGDFDELVGCREPGMMELQIWLHRRGLAKYTRVLVSEDVRSMHDLLVLTKKQLASLLTERVGLPKTVSYKVEQELAVRREVMGYAADAAQAGGSGGATLSAEERRAQQRRRSQRRRRQDGPRDWRNSLELRPGATMRRAVHKPLPCRTLPAALEPLEVRGACRRRHRRRRRRPLLWNDWDLPVMRRLCLSRH